MTKHPGEPSIDLTDPTLFGNDAAEDEDYEVFWSYVLERPELKTFADRARRIAIVRAYKGEGKSALLRQTAQEVEDEHSIVLQRTGANIGPELKQATYDNWLRHWKAAIFGVIASEVGSRIGLAWTDDAMSLVEQAEKTGSRERSLLTSILDRLPLQAAHVAGTGFEVRNNRPGPPDPAQAVRRWAAGKPPIWLLVDDVDKNFERTPSDKHRVAAFFDALRECTNALPELRVRAAVRPNVWTILKLEYESLSHVEQYIVDLSWSEEEMRRLLSRRVEGYVVRTDQMPALEPELPNRIDSRDKRLIGYVFGHSMRWGGGSTMRPPHVVLYTLSKQRPRWMIELAKKAAAGAARNGAEEVTLDYITAELETFGRRRIEDTAAEFRSQCPQILELVTAFSRGAAEYATDELLDLINRKILTHVQVGISGIKGNPSNREVAAFLFEIGFFYARRDHDDGSYEHFTYSQKPTLLKSRTALDTGVKWEIHPIYRQPLEIRR